MDTTLQSARLYDSGDGLRTTDLDDQRIQRRHDGQLLWIDLVGSAGPKLDRVARVVGQEPDALRRLLDRSDNGSIDDQGSVVGVHAFTIEQVNMDYERTSLDVAAGSNWVVTVHGRDTATVCEFTQRLETSKRVGELDGGSFIAFLLDWLF